MVPEYVVLSWIAVLLCVLKFTKVTKWIDVWTSYAFIYSVIFISVPYLVGPHRAHVKIAIESELWQFVSLLFAFIFVLKSNISSDRAKHYLAKLGELNIILSIVAVIVVKCLILWQARYQNLPSYWQEAEAWLSGIVPNKPMNQILNVVLLPFVIERRTREGGRPGYLIFPFAANLVLLYTSKSSSAYLAFCIMMFFDVLRSQNFSLVQKCVFAICVFTLFPVVGNYLIDQFLYDGYRYESWRFFFSEMKPQEWLIGHGPASFFPESIEMQGRLHYSPSGNAFVWMHCDILQYVWEYGFLGLIPLGYMLVGFFKRAKGSAFSAACAFLGGSLLYYPFHWPIHIAVMMLIVKIVVQEEVENSIQSQLAKVLDAIQSIALGENVFVSKDRGNLTPK